MFFVAGVAKLRDLSGSRQALRDFGLPRVVAAPLGVLLPLAEIAVAFVLLPGASAWLGAVGAVVLLVAFMVGIGVNLAQGKTPDCHCFGQLRSRPVGRGTLARDGALALLAVFVIARGPSHSGPSAVAWMGHLSTAEAIGLAVTVLGFALLAVQGWVIVNLLRQNGRLLLRLDALEAASAQGHQSPPRESRAPAAGLPVGAAAPAFELPDLGGKRVSLDALRAGGKPVVLLFTDPGCGPCNALLPDVRQWQQVHADRLTLAVISRGNIEENRAKADEQGVSTVLLQEDREVAAEYQAHATPSGVIVRSDGSIGSPIAAGADAIRALVIGAPESLLPLVRQAPAAVRAANGANGHPPQPALEPGDAAPPIRLTDLDGAPVDLADYRGRDTVVLFWNPGCGFCQRMLPDLRAWEEQRPEGSPELLVVSAGSVEDNRAQGIRSPLVLDQGFTTARAFGASGTPMAVLVGAEGKIASPLGAGAPTVLALLQGEVRAAT